MNIYSRTNPPQGFYVYAYIRKSNSTPYYIGKGIGTRAFVQHHKNGCSISTPRDFSKIVILEQNLSEIGALALERRMIRWYGRKNNKTGILQNRTDGGTGVSGMTHSEKTRAAMSKAHTGRAKGPFSKEHRNNLSAAHAGSNHKNFGQSLSDETKRRISEGVKKTYHVIKASCLTCKTVTNIGNYTKHHGANCKH
jgi:hypothetical protein